jgi:hypothetical protein
MWTSSPPPSRVVTFFFTTAMRNEAFESAAHGCDKREA